MKNLCRGAAALLLSSSAFAAAGASHAATFGPASGALVYLASPTVTIGATSGTDSFNGTAAIFSTTGSLTQATGLGTAYGTLTFSDVAGTTDIESLTNFLTFSDKSGGQFVFDVSSVQTISYSTSPASTSISLYLLGMASDSTLGLSPSATSVTLQTNSTAGSAFSASATLSSPPSIVSSAPEPSTWALMIAGVAMVGAALRFRRRTGVVAA